MLICVSGLRLPTPFPLVLWTLATMGCAPSATLAWRMSHPSAPNVSLSCIITSPSIDPCILRNILLRVGSCKYLWVSIFQSSLVPTQHWLCWNQTKVFIGPSSKAQIVSCCVYCCFCFCFSVCFTSLMVFCLCNLSWTIENGFKRLRPCVLLIPQVFSTHISCLVSDK